MRWLVVFISVILTVPAKYLASSVTGTVELDEYTFDKVVDKFKTTIVKFDVAFPYGDKHEDFVALAKESREVEDLLFAEVGIKDYGEKDNEVLGLRYGATKDNFPVVKLFLKGQKEPSTFDDSQGFSTELLRRFIREKSDIYLSLPGCIQELDLLAIKFKNSDKEGRQKVLDETVKVLEIIDNKDAATGKLYKTIMDKVLEKGDDFVKAEISRVKKLINDKISDKKKQELSKKINILLSFTLSSQNKKDEL